MHQEFKALGRATGRRCRWLLPLLGTTALALAACGGGEPATPTPAGLSPREVLDGAAEAMAQVASFSYSLDNQGGETPLPAGLSMKSARGVMVKPDKMTAEIKASFSGFFVEVKVISLGQRTFMTNPITGSWQTFESGLSPVSFFDPAKGVGLILQSLTEASLGEPGVAGGEPAYRVVGRLPAEAVQFMSGSFAEGSVLRAELLIGQDDLLLRRVRLEGRVTDDEPEGIVRVLTFSDFNQTFAIEPPV